LATQEDKFFAAAKQAEAPAQTAAEKPRRTWQQLGKRIVIEVIVGYLLLCLGLYLFQKRIVYMPDKVDAKADQSADAVLDPQEFGLAKQQGRLLSTKNKDNLTLRGWHISLSGDVLKEDKLAKAPAVVLFFCGNAGNRSDRVSKFRQLANMGIDVVCFDHRGYGDSEGSPNEEGLAADARAAWQFLISKGVSPQKIVLHGESLGGGVATRLASELCNENTPPGGLMLEATFTRLSDVGQKHYWFLPVSLILNQKFPSVDRIPSVTCPILILHGARDDLIPIQQGKDLFSAARGASQSGMEKQFVELPACRHNDLGIVNSAEYRAAVLSFLQKIAPNLEKPSATPAKRRPEEGSRKRQPRKSEMKEAAKPDQP